MTAALSSTDRPTADLRDAVQTLVAHVEALERGEDGHIDRSGLGAPQQALLRFVGGRAWSTDEQLLGMPVGGARLVVVLLSEPGNADRRRLAGVLGDVRGTVVAPEHEDRVVVLVRNFPRSAGEDRGLRAAEHVADLTGRVEASASVGISTALSGPGDLAPAFADAADAAAIARRSDDRVVRVDEAWAQITLERVGQRLGGCVTLANPLAVLAAHDERQGSELLASLGAWLRADRDTAATADALCLHPNTLRYRLRRAAQTSGLDLDDGAQRIVAELIERCVRTG